MSFFLVSMFIEERLELARHAYVRAVAQARAASTAASWKRLLRAAKNLGATKREQERGRVGMPLAIPGEHARTDAARAEARPERLATVALFSAEAPYEGGPVVRADAGAEWTRSAAERWPGLAVELERSHALRERSRQLMARSRALCAAIRELAARSPRSLPPTPGLLG